MRSALPVSVLGCALAIGLAVPAAAAGELFDYDGKQTMDFDGTVDVARAVVLQADGKMVVAGGSSSGAGDDFALARFNLDGTPDSAFSDDGRQTTDFAGSDDDGQAAVLQDDGKIVVAGGSSEGVRGDDFALARYNGDGTLDTSYSVDGRQTTDFLGADDSGQAIVLQPDGRVVVVGGSGEDFGLARYDVDGTLDASFASQGKQTTDFAGGYDTARGVALQSDGKIVVAGSSYQNGTDHDFALARYHSDGTLDATFSGDGRQTTDFARERPDDVANRQFDYGRALALQSDGKIVVAGSTDPPGSEGHVFALARYDTAGTLDTAFSNDGRQTSGFYGSGPGAIGHAIAIDLDGRVVVAGSSHQYYGDNFSLARFDSDGTPDRSFSRDGTLTSYFGTSNLSGGRGRAVIIQPDAKIVVAGDSDQSATDLDFALARYGPDGTLDGEFVEPVLSELRLDPTRFAAARSGAGTRVSYRLSEPAQVRFSLERGKPGRRSVRGFCTAPRPSNRRNEVCTRYAATPGFFPHSGRPGKNAFRFSSRLSGLALTPGRYRLVAVPTDAANNIGQPRRASFTLTGR